ncbi:MAG TPA: hypothetical protein VLW53_20900, partial [Candidatus Eisenbacteria bacterium]|nr:hypothetical protein [Candidatus Eisenbacteria bacterium]
AGLVLRAALLREESRGAHVRTDRPDEDSGWKALELVAGLDASGVPALTARRGAPPPALGQGRRRSALPPSYCP